MLNNLHITTSCEPHLHTQPLSCACSCLCVCFSPTSLFLATRPLALSLSQLAALSYWLCVFTCLSFLLPLPLYVSVCFSLTASLSLCLCLSLTVMHTHFHKRLPLRSMSTGPCPSPEASLFFDRDTSSSSERCGPCERGSQGMFGDLRT